MVGRCAVKRVFLAGLLVLATAGFFPTMASAGSGPSFFGVDAGKPDRPKVSEDSVRAALAKAWGVFYAGDLPEAVQLVVPLCGAGPKPSTDLAVQKAWVEAEHLLARCYWAHGSDQGRAKAKEIWAALSKVTGINANVQRQAVAKALMLEAANQPAEAIALLEGVLKRSWPDTCTAEAAIELARLEVKRKRVAEARNALQFAVGFLEDQAGKKELSAETVAPFIEAAKAAMGRLKYDVDPGRELFEKAESLRKKGKFLEAAETYKQVVEEFPATDYAPRSELHMGHCLLGLGKPAMAIEHWKKFITASPSGPWRGQAYVAIADVCLEEGLDLKEATKYLVMAAEALPASLKDPASAASWSAAAFDIHFRAGTVAYVRASYAEAARWLEAARAALAKDAPTALTAGLERLVAGAKAPQPILPDDVRGAAADKAALALSLGVVCNTGCDFARAERFFGRVLAMQGPGRTPEQTAFAHYGKAVALQGQRKQAEAKTAYTSSLKLLRGGSWQDETLYRLATLVEAEAEAKFGDRPPAKSGPKEGAAVAPASSADVARQEAERLARAAALAKACSEALPYWTELLRRYPQSLHTEAALYHAAALLAEAERWQETVGALERLLEKYPQGRWAGEAYLRLVDITLERLFELPAARKHAAAAVAWIKNAKPGSASPDSALPLWALADKGEVLGAEALKALGYTIYVRAGTVAYLDQKYEEAAAMFKAAEPLAPPRGFAVVRGHIPTAMERMIEAAKAQKKLTPDEVLKGDPKAKLILQLADIYVQASQYDDAIALCDRVIFTKEETPTPLQRSWAYNQKAAATYWRGDCVSSKAGYLTAVKACPEAPWAPRALFYVGTTTNNYGQDHASAAQIFKEIVRRYPKSDVADKAAYFVGVMYEVSAEYGQAKAAYEDFLKRYPDSKWVDLVRREHLKRVEEQLAAGVPESNGRKKR